MFQRRAGRLAIGLIATVPLGALSSPATAHARFGDRPLARGSRGHDVRVLQSWRDPSRARRGETVETGQILGEVDESGNARGCHLHFELWTVPGWYDEGEPYDPLPALGSWDDEAAA